MYIYIYFAFCVWSLLGRPCNRVSIYIYIYLFPGKKKEVLISENSKYEARCIASGRGFETLVVTKP